MVELTDLSRIGFGTYRVRAGSLPQAEALRHALRAGCNLIDTASTYMNGDSERLVGEVLREGDSTDVFVMTKAGYVQGQAFQLMAQLREAGFAKSSLARLSNDFHYSLHPDFLCCQLEVSLGRLGRQYVDGFFLHNPEHYFNQVGFARKEFDTVIRSAFEFLEEMVAEGRVRYYGVSSNTLASPRGNQDAIDLHRLVAIAEEVSTHHHFKLVQFPLNILETDAIQDGVDEPSLLARAKSLGLTTFINRPLNATSPEGFVRLATYDCLPAPNQGRSALDKVIEIIGGRMKELDLPGRPDDIGVIGRLIAHWGAIGTPEAVTRLFEENFFPMVDRLYQGTISPAEKIAFAALFQQAILNARVSLNERADQIRSSLVERGLISSSDNRPLAMIACESYLESGVDHVLVGMRDVRYVEQLKPLLATRLAAIEPIARRESSHR